MGRTRLDPINRDGLVDSATFIAVATHHAGEHSVIANPKDGISDFNFRCDEFEINEILLNGKVDFGSQKASKSTLEVGQRVLIAPAHINMRYSNHVHHIKTGGWRSYATTVYEPSRGLSLKDGHSYIIYFQQCKIQAVFEFVAIDSWDENDAKVVESILQRISMKTTPQSASSPPPAAPAAASDAEASCCL